MTTAKPTNPKVPAPQAEDEPIDYASLEYDPFEPEPLPDAMLQEPILRGLLPVLSSRARARNPGQPLFDSSNTIVCYDPSDLNIRVSPDYYFAAGIDPETVYRRAIYRTWVQGKPPDFVLEVASPSTARNDETTKRAIYAGMGVPEYWRYDPTEFVAPHRQTAVRRSSDRRGISGWSVPSPWRSAQVPEGCIMGFSPGSWGQPGRQGQAADGLRPRSWGSSSRNSRSRKAPRGGRKRRPRLSGRCGLRLKAN